MKKISYFSLFVGLMVVNAAVAYPYDGAFRHEISRGLDIVGAHENIDIIPDDAPGELGYEVYETVDAVKDDKVRLFIPTSMYIRAGGGLNLGFATTGADLSGKRHSSSGSWSTHIGLGWNLSSYVRTELNIQESTFSFSDIKELGATYRTMNGMLYFDFARRYVQRGDITQRRTFVPFMGLGVGAGQYAFDGPGGESGLVIAAPCASLGASIMFNDMIGLDLMYQYQMMINDGFGWNTNRGTVASISNIVASMRVNF